MILNPNNTKILVVSRAMTVGTPHGDLVFSGVSIRGSLNIDIHGVMFDSKLTFEDHVHGIVFRISENWYFEVAETYICGHLCVTSLLFSICSHNP